MVYAPNDSAQLFHKCFFFFFGSNLWKSSKAKYAFRPFWKQTDHNCIDTGHGKAGWLRMFCRAMMADQRHSTNAVLPTSLLVGGFGILTLGTSIAPQTGCPISDPACIMHRHHLIMLGTFLCHLLYLPNVCLSSPARGLSDGVAFGTNPLSTEKTNTRRYQKCEFARKNSKALRGERHTF